MKSKEWTCAICGSHEKRDHTFREMMFGFRDEFAYAECISCGCIQIKEIPQNIEKYYPPYYYSFNLIVPPLKRKPLLKRMIKDIRIKKVYKRNDAPFIQYLKEIRTPASHRILDVGCGSGQLICQLFNEGFEYVQGVDKFITEEIDHGFGVKVLKAGLEEIPSQSYHVVMMHHVLEHMENQLFELKEAYRILKRGSYLIIRIPVKARAWEIYKENWVQLDAPRHAFLHTEKSMKILAEKAGFMIKKTLFDSTSFQFWGSELYQKDIPLILEVSHKPYLYEKRFDVSVIANWAHKAKELNHERQGDQAIFYLYKNSL